MDPDSSSTRRRRSKPSPSPPAPSASQSPSSPVTKTSSVRDEDEARSDFLERNKLAARRHRERRKDYIANLERSLHITRQQLEGAQQDLDSLRHLATTLAQPPSTSPLQPPRAYTSNGYGAPHPAPAPPPPVPVSQPIQPLAQPGRTSSASEPRVPTVAARARLQALAEVFGRAVRSCDDPIPAHCDARFRDLLSAAEDAAAPIRALVLECEELSKTCVDASL
ncbi:hypothetical protein FS749_004329 [Ceratobasidium sp. UAMH 11750]|nr:hypothetical protein FS749_004329 [Ceratobasidium sp. UAMH 11750]